MFGSVRRLPGAFVAPLLAFVAWKQPASPEADAVGPSPETFVAPAPLNLVSLSVGDLHVCGVTSAGTAHCWGRNDVGQLGNGTTSDSHVPVTVAGGLIFASVSAGIRHTCGVTKAGTAFCWGKNRGTLGDGTTTDSTVPKAVSGGLTFASVSAGGGHTCGVTTTGAGHCWGANFSNIVGDGTSLAGTTNVPVAIAGGHSFSSISAGAAHSCGVTRTGSVLCWGSNNVGQLGDSSATHPHSLGPVPIRSRELFRTVSAGGAHSCGVTKVGSVYCWGHSAYGELGDGLFDGLRAVPTKVLGDHTFADVSAGFDHSCGLTRAGGILCWGRNARGQLGDGRNVDSAAPVATDAGSWMAGIWKAVDASVTFTCALLIDGTPYCWGDNDYGQLGNGTTTGSNVPEAVMLPSTTGLAPPAPGPSRSPVALVSAAPMTPAGDETVRPTVASVSFASVSAGSGAGVPTLGDHSCGVTTAGAAHCWGFNGKGGLGDGTNTGSNVPVPVAGGHTFASVSAGYFHSCGVTATGAAYCWGSNGIGQLGDGTTTDSNVPVAVTGAHGFASVSAGHNHTCGVTKSGAALCWGSNSWETEFGDMEGGTLGNGKDRDSAVPVPVSGGLAFASLTTGDYHSCGVTAGGAAYCWGSNEWGQLGNGATTSSAVPVAVSGDLTFTSVSARGGHSCGVAATGAAYCWGNDGYGELGNGTGTSSAVPVAVSGGHSFASVSVGERHTCGLTKTGAAHCWGSNARGKLGDGNESVGFSGPDNHDSEVPVAVSGGLTFASLSAGDDHSCGVTTAGDAYCWGSNSSGQLGDGSKKGSAVPVAVSLPGNSVPAAVTPPPSPASTPTAAPPSPAAAPPAPPPAPAVPQDPWAYQVAAQFDAIGPKLDEDGFDVWGDASGDMQQGQYVILDSLRLERTDYLIAGACDVDCGDLDLQVFDGNGKVVDSATAEDDVPILEFTPAAGGLFRVVVTMAQCTPQATKAGGCRWGVRAYGRY